MEMGKWSKRFLHLAHNVSEWSKDDTKVGCVITRDRRVLATGYNGFPRDVDETQEGRHKKPLKPHFNEHAERNAIYNAARDGVSLQNSTAYVWPLFPCSCCARGLIQVGVKVMVAPSLALVGGETWKKWGPSWTAAHQMLLEAGVEMILYDPVTLDVVG